MLAKFLSLIFFASYVLSPFYRSYNIKSITQEQMFVNDFVLILLNLYLFISFTLSRNLNAVLLLQADLLCFHISVDYIFIYLKK